MTFPITDVLRAVKSERTAEQCWLAPLSMTQVTSKGVDVEAEVEAADRAEKEATTDPAWSICPSALSCFFSFLGRSGQFGRTYLGLPHS